MSVEEGEKVGALVIEYVGEELNDDCVEAKKREAKQMYNMPLGDGITYVLRQGREAAYMYHRFSISEAPQRILFGFFRIPRW